MWTFLPAACGNPPGTSLTSSLPGAAYSSREGVVYLYLYVLCHVEGLAGKIAGGTISCPQVKPNLSSPVGIFWIGCLPKGELCCSQQKANLFWKSLSISRIGLRKLKEVMVLGRNLSKCAFHRIWQACLPVTWHLRKYVFVIVVFIIVVLNPFPVVSSFVRAFLSLGSHFHWDPCGSRFSWHLGNHTSTTWADWENFYNIRRERFQNVDAITKQCTLLLSYIDYPKCS